MKLVIILFSSIAALGFLVSCEDTVTQGPTTKARPSHTSSTTQTVVEEPQSVEIPTKAGSQNQNSLPHGQPDSSGY